MITRITFDLGILMLLPRGVGANATAALSSGTANEVAPPNTRTLYAVSGVFPKFGRLDSEDGCTAQRLMDFGDLTLDRRRCNQRNSKSCGHRLQEYREGRGPLSSSHCN
ncbi:hypothetical protein BD289DRAFT_243396 [Coniella lustricola]|uniref:Secreted protein n=1 Tax=Coniella lustricola TaxID=2025994 RepID=A0A2T3A9J6_9PEZI|nr:hypothetical protein BD289DRAFT_243396 [Coniella lustricola]